MPSSSSVSSEVAAVEIAQPLPSKATSATLPSSSSLRKTCCSSPQNGFVSSNSRSNSSRRPKLCGPLVVLEDLVAVELVHRSTVARARRPPGVEQALDQAVDLLAGGVDAEAGAGRGGDAEALHQRLGAVVAGADGDAVAVEDLGDVVGVDALELEGDGAAAVVAARAARRRAGRGPRRAARARRRRSRARAARTASMPERVEPAQRGADPDRLRDRRRAGLEAGGRVGVGGPLLGHLADHRAAAEERRHLARAARAAPRARRSRSAP